MSANGKQVIKALDIKDNDLLSSIKPFRRSNIKKFNCSSYSQYICFIITILLLFIIIDFSILINERNKLDKVHIHQLSLLKDQSESIANLTDKVNEYKNNIGVIDNQWNEYREELTRQNSKNTDMENTINIMLSNVSVAQTKLNKLVYEFSALEDELHTYMKHLLDYR